MKQETILEETKEARKAQLTRTRKFWSAAYLTLAIVAVACLLATIVCVLVLEMGEPAPARDRLLYILIGAFAGGAALLGAGSIGGARIAIGAKERELDFRERCVSEESFFVGEGTIATFLDGELHIAAEGAGVFHEDGIRVPYGEMRFYSVCTRSAPREKGVWSVVLEIPAKYLAKDGKAERNARPALVQTDGKERLYACLEERGLVLEGEAPPRGRREETKPFERMKSFSIPNLPKRRRALVTIVIGAAAIVAGILLAIFLNVSVGSLVTVIGAFVLGRSVASYVQARAVLSVYREGIFWRESDRTERTFLKWEEIGSIHAIVHRDVRMFKVQCAYGAYHFPVPAGAEEYLTEQFPEKCGGEG